MEESSLNKREGMSVLSLTLQSSSLLQRKFLPQQKPIIQLLQSLQNNRLIMEIKKTRSIFLHIQVSTSQYKDQHATICLLLETLTCWNRLLRAIAYKRSHPIAQHSALVLHFGFLALQYLLKFMTLQASFSSTNS